MQLALGSSEIVQVGWRAISVFLIKDPCTKNGHNVVSIARMCTMSDKHIWCFDVVMFIFIGEFGPSSHS